VPAAAPTSAPTARPSAAPTPAPSTAAPSGACADCAALAWTVGVRSALVFEGLGDRADLDAYGSGVGAVLENCTGLDVAAVAALAASSARRLDAANRTALSYDATLRFFDPRARGVPPNASADARATFVARLGAAVGDGRLAAAVAAVARGDARWRNLTLDGAATAAAVAATVAGPAAAAADDDGGGAPETVVDAAAALLPASLLARAALAAAAAACAAAGAAACARARARRRRRLELGAGQGYRVEPAAPIRPYQDVQFCWE